MSPYALSSASTDKEIVAVASDAARNDVPVIVPSLVVAARVVDVLAEYRPSLAVDVSQDPPAVVLRMGTRDQFPHLFATLDEADVQRGRRWPRLRRRAA